MTKFKIDVAGGGSAEELRRVVSSGLPQEFTFGGNTVEDALENAAELYDTVFEVHLARSVAGISAALHWTRDEIDAFIAEQIAEWFSVHRPQALKSCEAALRRYVRERR